LSTGEIVAIIMGSLVFTALVIVGICLFVCWYRKKKKAKENKEKGEEEEGLEEKDSKTRKVTHGDEDRTVHIHIVSPGIPYGAPGFAPIYPPPPGSTAFPSVAIGPPSNYGGDQVVIHNETQPVVVHQETQSVIVHQETAAS
jgi:hypothetical protein